MTNPFINCFWFCVFNVLCFFKGYRHKTSLDPLRDGHHTFMLTTLIGKRKLTDQQIREQAYVATGWYGVNYKFLTNLITR